MRIDITLTTPEGNVVLLAASGDSVPAAAGPVSYWPHMFEKTVEEARRRIFLSGIVAISEAEDRA